ncbi:hypothetical protein OHB33_40625 (plasmid) [Streptomyces sp. NBC_01558]|uniref:hypothetical protein n=1 Tax=Streptomyces sp. NBC_01558 TaxID=2975878 RepID=UPI002DD9696E|nr:hypothetical protein [Streptomyces sp. NBC_01558]WSD82696.1 hypothetical protein OHB33_40625 [Streptomyces sp. NBC_01558]
MNATFAQRNDNSRMPSGGYLTARVAGAAATGAALTYLSLKLVDAADHHDSQTCAKASGFCMTVWPVISIPASLAIAFVVLALVYRLLGIHPWTSVVPPTLLLTPLPVLAAEKVAASWLAVVVGAVMASALVLTLWRPFRTLGQSTTAVMFAASLAVLFL